MRHDITPEERSMGKRTWALPCVLLMAAATGDVAAQGDAANCVDHPLIPTRMANYRIEACKVEDYGLYEFYATKGPKTPVEGKFTFVTYAYTGERNAEPSG